MSTDVLAVAKLVLDFANAHFVKESVVNHCNNHTRSGIQGQFDLQLAALKDAIGKSDEYVQKLALNLTINTAKYISIRPSTVGRSHHRGVEQEYWPSQLQRAVHDHVMKPLLDKEISVEDAAAILEKVICLASGIAGVLASGQRVVDRHQSHLHPNVEAVLTEALSTISLINEQFQVVQVDFDHEVGKTTCVVTKSDDQIIFAQRPKRLGLTRFVMNREPETCSSVVCILMKAQDEINTYVLITAFIGTKPEPEPWDRNATAKSAEFWNSHAMVWESEPIVSGTETKVYPW